MAHNHTKLEFDLRCNNSDGANSRPSLLEQQQNPELYNRQIEPLAFSLEGKPANTQDNCPLLSIIPKEIRDMIYEYAFTDCTSNPPDRKNIFRDWDRATKKMPPSDIALPLLETCRLIYLEAYKLPWLLNPFIYYDFSGPFRPHFHRLTPWKFALIQSIDISLQQISLESGELALKVAPWRAQYRHMGTYVAPRYDSAGPDQPKGIKSFKFMLLKASDLGRESPRDGDEVQLEDEDPSLLNDPSSLAPKSTACSMVARPITRLTLRLARIDWWTWGTDPAMKQYGELRLDPAFDNRGSTALMLELAAARRSGRHPDHGKNWGSIIEKFPDLKTLELVLETFAVKKDQLETVVECAKTWKFPLQETEYELVWDGAVEEAQWSEEPVDENAEAEAEEEAEEDVIEEEEEDEDEEGEEDEMSDEEDGTSDEEYDEDDDDPTPAPPRPKSWNELCTDFEVRIVRFKRRKVE